MRATLAAPGERALATRDASLSLSLRPQDGFTPLHIARSEGHADVVRILIEAGAEVRKEATAG